MEVDWFLNKKYVNTDICVYRPLGEFFDGFKLYKDSVFQQLQIYRSKHKPLKNGCHYFKGTIKKVAGSFDPDCKISMKDL